MGRKVHPIFLGLCLVGGVEKLCFGKGGAEKFILLNQTILFDLAGDLIGRVFLGEDPEMLSGLC